MSSFVDSTINNHWKDVKEKGEIMGYDHSPNSSECSVLEKRDLRRTQPSIEPTEENVISEGNDLLDINQYGHSIVYIVPLIPRR